VAGKGSPCSSKNQNTLKIKTFKKNPENSIDLGRLHGYLGYLLQRAQMLATADFIAEMAELDLRPGQFAALTVIDANPGLRQSEVSAALGIQKTNFVAAMDGIERRGLAVRKAVAGDKRSYALHLTAAGKALLRRARAAQARHEARLAERLGERGDTPLTLRPSRASEPCGD
jgi:DNA-binding MarR family transcriptional regulator